MNKQGKNMQLQYVYQMIAQSILSIIDSLFIIYCANSYQLQSKQIYLIIIQMNLFNFLCCSQKKPPQTTKIITVKSIPAKNNIEEPKSQPFINTDKYVGQQLNGLPHGNGEMFYKNGDYYRGEWINGKRQGRGVQMYHQSARKYEGEWKDNLPNGQGKLTFENQSYYVGEFKQNQQHGIGQFFNGQQNTTAQQFFQNGVMIHEKVKQSSLVRQSQFPTLVLDKERFNSEDLLKFQEQNLQIKQLDIQFLAKYFAICKIIKLVFIEKQIKEWTVGQVIDFLQAIDLQYYKEVFYKNRIKGKDLITISQQQMKEDLKMKLGDRKRLINYCNYLTQLYNPDQKKKKDNRKQTSNKKINHKNFPRAHSLNSNQYASSKFKTAVKDVIEQISESFQQSFQHSQKSQESQNQKRLKNKFGTDQWDQYHSNVLYSLAIPIIHKNQIVQEDQIKAPPYSQCSESSSNQNSLKNSMVKNSSVRKVSIENDDLQLNSIHLKEKHSLGLQMFNASSFLAIQADNNIQKKSSTSSSDASISSVQFQLQRKKTGITRNKDGGMQMRELYQFLKSRGNLQFIIKPKQIQILQMIGEGGYGKVYQGKYMSCPVAVKDYIKAGKHKSQQDFLKELEILSDLKHPNIVLYMGLCITSDKYQLVTEYLQNGSLFDQLHKKKKKFTRDQIVQIIDDIVKGMVYLHNMKNILHRDLKSSNVLIGQDWKVKLCDFGLSGHKKKRSKKSKGRVGTYQWMAPQVMRKEEMDFFSDVYSFGVIIWQLITQKIPYEGYTEAQIIGEVGYDQNYMLRIQNPEWDEDDFVVKLMKECLKRKASQRPTFIQIQSKLTQYMEYLESLRQKTYSY